MVEMVVNTQRSLRKVDDSDYVCYAYHYVVVLHVMCAY